HTLPLERTQVAREVLPRPRDTGAQRLDGHALDEEEELHERLAVSLAAGRDGEPAVAHDDGRDAVPRRGARLRVPEELAVVVGMDVDEAGGEGEARAVELAGATLGDAPDGRYTVAGDGEIARRGLAAAAITEERAPDDHAETLGEDERDTLAIAARAALGDDVARHLEDGGRHAGEPAPELAGRRLRPGGRGEEKRECCEREPASHGAPSYSLASIDSALHTLSPGPGSTWSCSTLPSFTTMP